MYNFIALLLSEILYDLYDLKIGGGGTRSKAVFSPKAYLNFA